MKKPVSDSSWFCTCFRFNLMKNSRTMEKIMSDTEINNPTAIAGTIMTTIDATWLSVGVELTTMTDDEVDVETSVVSGV